MTADPLTDLLAAYGIAGTAYNGLPAAIRREVLAPIRGLIPDPPIPLYDGKNFNGFKLGPEHRTVGSHRAWCYDASEWCYPKAPCSACEEPITPQDLRDLLDGAG